jgi:hypothetical protein
MDVTESSKQNSTKDKKLFFWVSSIGCILMWILAFLISSHKALPAALAGLRFELDHRITGKLGSTQETPLESARTIQRFFLKIGIYIPIDDITTQSEQDEGTALLELNERACGSGIAYVWIPLRFQLPIFGEKVLEWCQVKN